MMMMRMMTTNSNYYCSQKFWYLSVNIEKLLTQSCCAADPQKINIDWISNNPGKLFNTLELQSERRAMLDNNLVASCNSSCWIPEERGLASRRLLMGSEKKTHADIESTPEFLNIMIGSHCNMTCVYCCKQNSSAWFNDIYNNGTYAVTDVGDRFTINNKDLAVAAISQKEINISPNKIKLFDELGKISDAEDFPAVVISGGEPFLYLYLNDLIEKFPKTVCVSIFTGLGVDGRRFARELDKLIVHPNISLVISAENINKNYEVVRAGNPWQQFENNLSEIQKRNIKYSFSSVLSNLTLFGLVDFINYVGDTSINFEICNTPNFLSMHVMDDKSKETIYNNIDKLPTAAQDIIKNSLSIEPTITEQHNLKMYLIDFMKRRNLSLNIFPITFTEWIKNVV